MKTGFPDGDGALRMKRSTADPKGNPATAWTRIPVPTALALASLTLAGCATAPDATSLLQQAEAAMQGSAAARSLVVTGNGTGNTFGQAWQPTMAWPGLNYATWKRSYNLDTVAFGEEFARSRSEPNGGRQVPGLRARPRRRRPVSATHPPDTGRLSGAGP